MISNIFKGTIKFTVTSLCVACMTYAHADKITTTLNTIKYTFTEPETDFVKKEQALDLKIIYERNGKGNLETFLRTYNQKLPVYQRQEGLMIGTSEYLAKNFSKEEKGILCATPKETLSEQVPSTSSHTLNDSVRLNDSERLKKMVYDLYAAMEGEQK